MSSITVNVYYTIRPTSNTREETIIGRERWLTRNVMRQDVTVGVFRHTGEFGAERFYALYPEDIAAASSRATKIAGLIDDTVTVTVYVASSDDGYSLCDKVTYLIDVRGEVRP